MKYKLNENQYNVYKMMIKEDAESTSQKKAIEYAKNVMGLEPSSAEDYVRKTVRSIFPYLNGNRKAGKYTQGLLRLLDTEVKSIKDRMELNSCLETITNNEELYSKFDRNFNDLSYKEVVQIVNDVVPELTDEKSKKIVKVNKSKNYTIKCIDSYSDANEYKDIVSWCVCNSKGSFESYCDNGWSQFYFCFHKDMNKFKNNKTPVFTTEKGHILNDYALSALAICIDNNGKLKSCTTRLNHGDNCEGYPCGDHELSVNEIEQILGVDFKETFKITKKQKERNEELFKFINLLQNVKDFDEFYNMADDTPNFVDNFDNYGNIFHVTLINEYDMVFRSDEDETRVEYLFTSKNWCYINFNHFLYFEDGIIKSYKDGKISNIDTYSGEIDKLTMRRTELGRGNYCYIEDGNGLYLIYNPKTYKKKSFKGQNCNIDSVVGKYCLIVKGDDTYLFNFDTLTIEEKWNKDLSLADLKPYGNYYYSEYFNANLRGWNIKLNSSNLDEDSIGMLYDSKFNEIGPLVFLINYFSYNPNIGICSLSKNFKILDYKIKWFSERVYCGLLFEDVKKGIVCILQNDTDANILVIENIKDYYYNENKNALFIVDYDGNEYDTCLLRYNTKDIKELKPKEHNYIKYHKSHLSKDIFKVNITKMSMTKKKQ